MEPLSQTDLRLRLMQAGYSPIPLHGKIPAMEGWQQKITTNAEEIALWGKLYPSDENTGILTRLTPTLDVDILDQAAAEAVEELAKSYFEERGYFLVRIGKAPKRAIPLRTDKPFKKLALKLRAGNGQTAKVEILADGQQVVVSGIHPETLRPYTWHGCEPWAIDKEDLPYISEEEAHKFLADCGQMLARDYGYAVVGEVNKSNGTAGSTVTGDWGDHIGAVLSGADLHDATAALAAKLVAGGLSDGASVRLLRALMGASITARDRRWQDRYDDIPRAVRTARNKIAPVAVTIGPLEEWDAGEEPGPLQPRGWLCANQFCRRFLSSIVAAGGTGKTALRTVQFIALATGRPLLKQHIFRRCRVLLISLEDDHDELQRRIKAVLDHYEIPRRELKGWLFCASPKLSKIAVMQDHARVVGPLEKQIRDAIIRREPDIVSFDPFIKTHGLDENTSGDMDFVCDLLARLAVEFSIAVDSPHHVKKGQVVPGDADSGRGSSGIRDAGRLVFTLAQMSADEASLFGINADERQSYVRLDSAKLNIAPGAAKAEWFRLVSVAIGNTTDEYPNGDHVQVVEPWTPAAAFDGTANEELNQILDEIEAGVRDGENKPTGILYSNAPAATHQVWRVVARQYPQKPEGQCRQIIHSWIDSGLLVVKEYYDKAQRKSRRGLAVDASKRF